jgi:hypothetical protein
MNTDDLIRALSADAAPERPLTTSLLLGLVPAVGFACIAVWTVLGFRPDLAQSAFAPVSAARFVLTGALAIAGLRISLALARPDGRMQTRLWPMAFIGAIALGLLIWAFATTPADARQMAVTGKTMTACLISIPLLAILPVASIFAMLRHGATTWPRLASMVAGLTGGGAAAAVYALHCTEDNPLFYVTWYGLAIAGVTLAATLIGPRLLRW